MSTSNRSSSADLPSSFATASTLDLEPLLYAFEQAWQTGNRPPLETLLNQLPVDGPAADAARRRLLEEMVKIDLEYRWGGSAVFGNDDLPARPLLEDYLQQYPALGPSNELSIELIGEEYRVRRLWGDGPQAESYFTRFPRHAHLSELLAHIDAELAERAGCATLQTQARTGQADEPLRAVPDGYEILGELGRGGMGVVYQARQLCLNRRVAIKMIRTSVQAGPAELSRFRTEAEAAARVQHPHVVQVYEVGEKDGQPFCVMEYVNGGSLSRCLAGAPLEPRAAAGLLETLARAVQAIHDQGILHRDLKPANVLLHVSTVGRISNPSCLAADDSLTLTPQLLQSPVCVPKISDFGLAKPAESVGLTLPGMVLGTPSYMAPEQADSRSEAIGPAADVYGLGAIFYELLTGRPPFRGVTVLETLEQVRQSDPLPPCQLQPAVPRDLETICLKCLQKEPAKRYGSAASLAGDLERFRQDRPILARPSGRWERGFKWARRRPALATLAAALVLGFAASLADELLYTFHLQAARAETKRQHQQVGRSYRKALEAVEQMLVRMGAQRVEAIPGTEKVQVDALTDAIRLYQELLDEQEQPDPDLYTRLGYALSYLGNLQMGLGQSGEAENNSRRGLGLLNDLPKELRTKRSRQQSAFARYVLGNILAAKNERTEAQRLYREASDILSPLEDDAEALDLLSHCHSGLANLGSDLAHQYEHYRQAREISEKIHKKYPQSGYYHYRYGETLYNLARTTQLAGRAEDAERLFQSSVDLLQPIAVRSSVEKDEPASRIRSQVVLLHCYSGLGMLWSNRGSADKFESFHLKACAVGEELVRIYPHPARRQELGQCYLNLGAAYQASWQVKKAEEIFRKAAAIQEALVHDLPAIALYRLNLAGTYVNLGLLLSSDRAEEALAVLHKGRDLLEPLWSAHPEDARYAIALSSCYNNEAQLLRHRDELNKAMPLHNRAVEVASTTLDHDPMNARAKNTCVNVLGARAQTWGLLEKHKQALADWDRLLEVAGPAEADKYRNCRAWSLAFLGDHRQALEDIEKYLHRPNISPDERYFGATALASTLETAQKDPRLSSDQRKAQEDRYTARALEVLTQLHRDGYFRDPAKQQLLDKDEGLAELRLREDFKRWHRQSSGK